MIIFNGKRFSSFKEIDVVFFKVIFVIVILVVFSFFWSENLYADYSKKEVAAMGELKVESSAFEYGGIIPSKYTCDGEDISPPIRWSRGPDRTVCYAIIADDPDAPMGTWVHWVVYNIPSSVTELPEGVPPREVLSDGTLQGRNDFRRIGYGGPCPPGGTHRYFFKVYALDDKVENVPGLTKKQLLKKIEKHILAKGELMGRYSR